MFWWDDTFSHFRDLNRTALGKFFDLRHTSVEFNPAFPDEPDALEPASDLHPPKRRNPPLFTDLSTVPEGSSEAL